MMTEILIAPTERPPISNLGQTSSLPESLGSDLLWESKHGLVGVQRKEVSDLIASVRDGRLGKEFIQMQTLKMRFLVIEGQPNWDSQGNLMHDHTRWNVRQHMGVMLSAQTKGVLVLQSRNALDTCAVVEYLVSWCEKDDHVSSLLARPGPAKNGWGDITERDSAIHIYSGIPSVGPTLAARIYDAGIRLLVAGTTVEELMTVRGIAKPTASAILSAIGGAAGSETISGNQGK